MSNNNSFAIFQSTHSHRTLPCRFLPVLMVAAVLGGCFAGRLTSAEPTSVGGPLFQEAIKEFTSMTTTLYQHHTRVNRAAGNYRYDCVGFVSYALKQAAPMAWATTVKLTGIAKGSIPSPSKYRAFFASLAEKPQPGWEAVTKAAALRPGDIVAWEHKTPTSLGHAVVIGGIPSPGPDGSWLVEVYDSTSPPHGNDSRLHDQRVQVMEGTGRRGGLGHGLMVFLSDPATGALTGYRWGPKGKAVTVLIAAARPVSTARNGGI